MPFSAFWLMGDAAKSLDELGGCWRGPFVVAGVVSAGAPDEFRHGGGGGAGGDDIL